MKIFKKIDKDISLPIFRNMLKNNFSNEYKLRVVSSYG